MYTKKFCTLALPLTLPLLVTACTESDALSPEHAELTSERIAVTSVEITTSDDVYLNHPLRVAVSGTTSGEQAYRTDLLVAMRSVDGEVGCVLGPMPVEHAPGVDPDGQGDLAFEGEAEFVLSNPCYELAGRDDIEIFTSFDPWNQLGDRNDLAVDEGSPEGGGFELYDIVAASALSAEGCESCETTYAVYESPGYDAQLRSLELDSAVAVVSVEDEEGNAPELGNQPHFAVSASSRVTGLTQGLGLADGLVGLSHRIRPLGSSDAGLALTRLEDMSAGVELATPSSAEVPVRSHGTVANTDGLFIVGEAREAIAKGAWSHIDEFEVVTCLETEFDQAIYNGESQARPNDCAAVPVLVARHTLADEARTPRSNGSKSRPADIWEQDWSASSGYGFGESGVNFKAWLESSSADGPTTTEKGIEVHSAGSWFEAGVFSEATVFGSSVTLVDVYGTFLAYDWGGGGVAMHASIINNEIIPAFEIQLADGVPVSLQGMLDLAGVSTELTISKQFTLAGVNFNDGCGSVDAGLWIEATLGVNTDETSITPMVTDRGVKLQGVFQPYVNLAAKAGTTVSYGEFVSGGITATLDLIDVQMPFTATAELQDFEVLDAQRLYFTQNVGAQLSTLSGSIEFSINWKIGFPCVWGCSGDHTHTIATWSGLSTWVDFFTASQTMTIGSQRPFGNTTGGWCTGAGDELLSGDFNGDGYVDWLCQAPDHRKHIDYNDGANQFNNTDFVTNGAWCAGNGQLIVGDFNGDQRDDLLCHDDNDKWIDYADQNGHFHGTDYHVASNWCTHTGGTLRVDDYNGDGKDDLLCRGATDSRWYDYADQNGHFHGTDLFTTGTPQFRRTKLTSHWMSDRLINMENGLAASGVYQSQVGSGFDLRDWVFENVPNTSYYTIRNASTGCYLHRETGPLQCNNNFFGHSGQWFLDEVPGLQKTYRIGNHWTGEYIHHEHGPLEVGHIDAGANSSQWIFDGSFFL